VVSAFQVGGAKRSSGGGGGGGGGGQLLLARRLLGWAEERVGCSWCRSSIRKRKFQEDKRKVAEPSRVEQSWTEQSLAERREKREEMER